MFFSSAELGRKRNPLLFDDDRTDDLLDALGFDSNNNNNSKKSEQVSWLNNDGWVLRLHKRTEAAKAVLCNNDYLTVVSLTRLATK